MTNDETRMTKGIMHFTLRVKRADVRKLEAAEARAKQARGGKRKRGK